MGVSFDRSSLSNFEFRFQMATVRQKLFSEVLKDGKLFFF